MKFHKQQTRIGKKSYPNTKFHKSHQYPLLMPFTNAKYQWDAVFEKNSDINNKSCIIVIPIYKRGNLQETEKMSLKQCCAVLGKEYEICFICPKSLNTRFIYDELIPDFKFSHLYVDDTWLSSQKTYADLCVIPEFYQTFSDYNYMLIYQLDAFVNNNKINDFIELGYDYYGAPILDAQGGFNGGFSLRKISSMINICKEYKPFNRLTRGIEEDRFFSRCPSVKHASFEINDKFATQDKIKKQDVFGMHYFNHFQELLSHAILNKKYE